MVTAVMKERFELITSDQESTANEFSKDVAEGLSGAPKRLPSVYFYDKEGSLLFEKICDLPEYYLTRTETEILNEYADEISSKFTEDIMLVELGSGSSAKTRILIESFIRRFGSVCYYPIDISRTMLENSSKALLKDYPGLEITAVAARYREGLNLLKNYSDRPKLILWLGSSIGNFDHEESVEFLIRLRETITSNDGLIVGADLRKSRNILERAYDDSQGVTAAFNLNILKRINRELNADFNPGTFRHHAHYDEESGRVEMHLISKIDQSVQVGEEKYSFAEGESIWTESSYKYSLNEFSEIADQAGFAVEKVWMDEETRFSLQYLIPKGTL
ncbi:MAG: L-histidine N(alpha)-methyltransferase [Calditrichaceae bacterium]